MFLGEKAISIIQLHYSSIKSSTKKQPLQRLVSEEQVRIVHPPSTFLSSPELDLNRVYQYKDIDMVSSSEQDTISLERHKKKRESKWKNGRMTLLASIAESDLVDENHSIEKNLNLNSEYDQYHIDQTYINTATKPNPIHAAEQEKTGTNESISLPINEQHVNISENANEMVGIAPAAENPSMDIDLHAKDLSPQSQHTNIQLEKEKSRKRNRDHFSSSELNSSISTPFRKRIPMTLQTDTQTKKLRITLDHQTSRSSLQQMVKSFLANWDEEEWDFMEPEDTKSICWFGIDGIMHEFDALDDKSVWSIEGLIIRV